MNPFTTIRRIAAALLSEHTPDDGVGAVAEALAERLAREIARLAKAESLKSDYDVYERVPLEDLRMGDHVHVTPSATTAQGGYVARLVRIDDYQIAAVPASWEDLHNTEFCLRTSDVRESGAMRLLARAKPKGST